MFMLSFFLAPKGVLKKVDFYRSRFISQEYDGRKKYDFVKWSKVCLPKDQGALGILDLEKNEFLSLK